MIGTERGETGMEGRQEYGGVIKTIIYKHAIFRVKLINKKLCSSPMSTELVLKACLCSICSMNSMDHCGNENFKKCKADRHPPQSRLFQTDRQTDRQDTQTYTLIHTHNTYTCVCCIVDFVSLFFSVIYRSIYLSSVDRSIYLCILCFILP